MLVCVSIKCISLQRQIVRRGRRETQAAGSNLQLASGADRSLYRLRCSSASGRERPAEFDRPAGALISRSSARTERERASGCTLSGGGGSQSQSQSHSAHDRFALRATALADRSSHHTAAALKRRANKRISAHRSLARSLLF